MNLQSDSVCGGLLCFGHITYSLYYRFKVTDGADDTAADDIVTTEILENDDNTTDVIVDDEESAVGELSEAPVAAPRDAGATTAANTTASSAFLCTCQGLGGRYCPGDTYKALDGCNKCVCGTNGVGICTKVRCEAMAENATSESESEGDLLRSVELQNSKSAVIEATDSGKGASIGTSGAITVNIFNDVGIMAVFVVVVIVANI